MKVIELLNKINNNEEVPEKVKYEDTIFEYDKDRKEYIHKVDDWYSETLLFKITNEHTHFIQDLLKAEVEVIEENKEIEELHILDEGESNEALYKYCSKLLLKQNELIRAVNKIKKHIEESETEDIDTTERQLNKMFKERDEIDDK